MPTDNALNLGAELQPALDWPIAPQISLDRPTLPRYMFIASMPAGRAATAKAETVRREKMQRAALSLDGCVERLASPFGDGMIYTICELPSNRAAASFATVMRAAYNAEVRTVALPKPRRGLYQST
jgi:hypothetical protein